MFPRLALAVSILFMAATPSLAQNRHFADGANGITAQLGWVTADDADGYGAGAMLTFNGRLDVGVTYVAPEQEVQPGYSLDWQEITPRLGISLVRPRYDFPVGVDAVASYTFIKFDGTMQDLVGGDSQTLGIEISGRFGGEQLVQLVPAFGILYRKSNAWVRQEADGDKWTTSTSEPMVTVECALLVAERFMIVPGTAAFDGDTTWSISAGFAMSLK